MSDEHSLDQLALPDFLSRIRTRTPARVLVDRAGAAYRTPTLLELRQAHAAARDAVRTEFELERDLGREFVHEWKLFAVGTQARSKDEYLLRPDLGRRLSEDATAEIKSRCPKDPGLQVVIGDGLSVTAVAAQVPRLLPLIAERAKSFGYLKRSPATDTPRSPDHPITRSPDLGLGQSPGAPNAPGFGVLGWSSDHQITRSPDLFLGQVFAIRHCRVGVMNDIGELLQPKVVVLLIGERPGLATAESLSAYTAYRPQAGHTDAQRNLISNIHARGVPVEQAAERIVRLAAQMIAAQRSGVEVKEELPAAKWMGK